MNVFKTKWYILKKIKQGNKENIYLVFSCEYWKILCLKKDSSREKTLDIWYNINFEVEVKGWKNIHKIRNIKIVSEFNYNDRPYKEIELYMHILAYINNFVREWMIIPALFNIMEELNNNISETQLVLLGLKVKSTLWELQIENSNEKIERVLKFISQNNEGRILKLVGIDDETKKELRGVLPF